MRGTCNHRRVLSNAEITRYSRHVLVPDVGRSGQECICAARILVIGAGGLGSPALMYLAAAGVGVLGVCDFDRVDTTNLQRQVIHNEYSLGVNKADSAARFIAGLNSSVRVTVHDVALTRENIQAVVADYDLVLDACDNFSTRYLISDACVALGKPCVFGSVFQIEGQVTVFDNSEDGFCYRDLFPVVPPDDVAPKGSVIGIWGPLCGVIGSMMASAALQVVLGKPALIGRLLVFDAMAMSCEELAIARAERPPRPRDMDADGTAPLAETGDVATIQPAGLADFVAGCDALVVDIRSDQEREICLIPGSLHIPQFRLLRQLSEHGLERERHLVLYCKDGVRAQQEGRCLAKAGYRHVFVLDGGIVGWLVQTVSGQPLY